VEVENTALLASAREDVEVLVRKIAYPASDIMAIMCVLMGESLC
jgi:hypothetical protein